MGKKILLVDDSKPMLTLLSGLFKSTFEVMGENSVASALASLVIGQLPDLIITDLNMPEVDGYEFVKQLKANSYYNQIPVLVLSGNQTSAEKLKLLKLGVDDFVGKPFNPEELYLRAEKLLRNNIKDKW